MELPVQYNTFAQEQIKDLLEKEMICGNTETYPIDTTFFGKTNTTTFDKVLKEEIQKEQVMKKWIQTVCLEKEILERELTHRNFNVQVDPTKRIIIVKVLTPCNTTVLFKKMIRVPEHVSINHLKVCAIPEQKMVLIKAPFTRFQHEQVFNTTTGRMCEEELPMERVMELEPTLYKMVQQMRHQLPSYFVPRVIRHLETGLLKVVLDMVCDREQMCTRPEDLSVKVNEIERCLAIKVLCDKFNQTRMQQLDTPFFFQPKEMYHQFVLPTFVNLAQVQHYPINERLARIELPIIREQLRAGLCNNTCFNNQWTRCL